MSQSEQQNKQELINIVQTVLDYSKTAGASAVEIDIGTGSGLSITARMGEVETVEHQRDKGLSVTVFINKQKGSANTTDFSDKALLATVEAACSIAKYAGEDDCAGLIDIEYLATEFPDLDIHHPWELNPEEAIDLAVECEQEARQVDKRIINSDGATVNSYSGIHVYGNSHNFINGWDWSSHGIDCAVIAEQDGAMQRDGWFSKARDYHDLLDTKEIGKQAANRTLARLGSRKLSTRNVPVIFEAPVAKGLFSAFISAVSGVALYRKATFLLDKMSERVFADHIHIHEQPYLKKGIGSASFDGDGMATKTRDLVKDGILLGYVLSAYSARKLKMTPTGNAGGVHNLTIDPGKYDLDALIKELDTGLLITDMIGFGINNVTGDYSRGASGLWIENGEFQYPVEEITVAGNLADMFKQIVEVGNDVDLRGNVQCGSVLIENMMVAGS